MREAIRREISIFGNKRKEMKVSTVVSKDGRKERRAAGVPHACTSLIAPEGRFDLLLLRRN